jgi:hypothetical protein
MNSNLSLYESIDSDSFPVTPKDQTTKDTSDNNSPTSHLLNNRDSFLKVSEALARGTKADPQHLAALQLLQKDLFNINWDAVSKDTLRDIVEDQTAESVSDIASLSSSTSDLYSTPPGGSMESVHVNPDNTSQASLSADQNQIIAPQKLAKPNAVKYQLDEYGFIMKSNSTASAVNETKETGKEKRFETPFLAVFCNLAVQSSRNVYSIVSKTHN